MPYVFPDPRAIRKSADHTANFTEVTSTFGYPEGEVFIQRRNQAVSFSNVDLGVALNEEKTQFLLPVQIVETENLLVFINGIYQDPTKYILNEDGTVIEFDESIPEDYRVTITYTR